MAQASENTWQGPIQGLVVTRYQHGATCRHIEVIEASHPVPDEAGQQAARRMLQEMSKLDETDAVFFLISGGGSSLLGLPIGDISLQQKKEINRALLHAGAPIDEMNCVRKHLSAIKGGRLAQACAPAQVITLAISDVPGDDPSVIASGPTVGDPSTSQQALEILQRYDVNIPTDIVNWLQSPASETVKPNALPEALSNYYMIATPEQSLKAAQYYAEQRGYATWVLGDTIEGEAREVAKVMAGMADYVSRSRPFGNKPCVILSGGETTVTVRGNGRGGRNAEFLLSLACQLKGAHGIYAVAADTDGIDGSEDNAGAFLSPDTFSRAQAQSLNPKSYLSNNDGYAFFQQLDDLLITGPTRTNVNDFRAILIK